jgi:outer membrane receptor protein involved in Fe transport
VYGSDAIAGVGNFLMRERIARPELRLSYQSTLESGQVDWMAAGAAGYENGPLRVAAGLEYLDRSPLDQNDRAVSRGKIRSALGFPGAFQPATLPIIDPNCEAGGGRRQPLGIPGQPNVGFCSIDLTPFFELISAEQRLTGYATATLDFDGGRTAYAELGFARNEAEVKSAPAFPNLKFPIVPANNPGNLVANGGFGVPVRFFGRALSGRNYDPTFQGRENTAFRLVAGLRGPLAGGFDYDVAAVHSTQRFKATNVRDVKIDRFAAALAGVGGPNNNQFFNPFGSSLTNPALANSRAVIEDFTANSWRDYEASLTTGDAVLSGDWLSLPAGRIGVALGAQVRSERLSFASDADSRNGNLTFLFSGPNFEESRTIYAAFAELAVPLHKRLEAQLAARYESYGSGIGESLDPKIALRWEPVDGLVLRGSAGTSFRAPSLSQITSISTINESVADPLNRATIPFFTAVVTTPNTALKPEEAVNTNLGVVWTPVPAFTVSLDYWRYDYSDIIVKQNAQAIVNANPNDPRVLRPTGPTGLISQVRVSFVNANSVETDGYDITARYDVGLGRAGALSLTASATYIASYLANENGVELDLVGLRNFQNFARSLPQWRASASAGWELGPHKLGATLTYIDSYKENLNDRNSPINGFEIASWTSVDVQYSLALEAIDADLQVGLINAFDETPPPTGAPGDLQGFDRLVHDPRGAMAYARIAKRF